MKLILGTAQLSMDYGISNKSGIPNNNEIKKLFEICKKNNIDYCDTALAYGNAHELLSSKGFKIITKIIIKNESKTKDKLQKIISEFKENELNTILVHNPKMLIEKPEIWKLFREIKEENKIRIGISVYTPDETNQLLSNGIVPDVLQLPYNIFDRKFDNILPKLKRLKIEIHARSIFLQGLFLIKITEIPKKLEPLFMPLSIYDNICHNNPKEKIKNAIHFVMKNQFIDKIIVGVEKSNQLNELIRLYKSYNGEAIDFKYKFNEVQKELLNPSFWK